MPYGFTGFRFPIWEIGTHAKGDGQCNTGSVI